MANQCAGKASSESPALKPYRGKPAVRNFRGGNGNVGIIRSPVRAIALPDNGVAFTGEGKLSRKATGYEQQRAGAALSRTGFAGCASRASGRPWSASVTHRFLRRGCQRRPGRVV